MSSPPIPPFPDPDSPVLKLIVDEAHRVYEAGETSVGVATTHAAVNASLEGHLEGEESPLRSLSDLAAVAPHAIGE